MTSPLYERPIVIERCMFLESSYHQLLGKPLLPPEVSKNFRNAAEMAEGLYREKSMAIIAHDAQPDPIFWFGNKRALKHFMMTPDEFVAMHSRESAPVTADNEIREERARMLKEVQMNGYVTGYNGIRKSKTGHLFQIVDVTIFNIYNYNKMYVGQGAVFKTVRPVPAGARPA